MQDNTLLKFNDVYLFSIMIGFSVLISSVGNVFALETNNSDSNMLVNANMTNNNFMNNSETNNESNIYWDPIMIDDSPDTFFDRVPIE